MKRVWGASTPRYDCFYELDVLLQSIMDAPIPTSEQDIRLRLILLLRFLCLYRGVDLARSQHKVVVKQSTWFLNMRRKGEKHFSLQPVPEIAPQALNPRFWLIKYVALIENRGSNLFWTLPGKGPVKPLS